MAVYTVKYTVNTEQLIAQGNQHRENNQPEEALASYAQAFVMDRRSASAFNNYGNVLREVGDPEGAVPFLQQAIRLEPNSSVARFNLAVALLLSGNYKEGWPAYETRWNYEHLDGTLPKFDQPRWSGQDLNGKTIFVVGEQGHGDTIQFSRFLLDLHRLGARVILQTNNNLAPLFDDKKIIAEVVDIGVTPPYFEYWAPIMSLPGILGIELEHLTSMHSYLVANNDATKNWLKVLGPKTKLRVGFCWSGRRDTWINKHKGMPFVEMLTLIKRNPNYEWINLQADATDHEVALLAAAGVKMFPGAIRNFGDTAALVMTLDVVLSVDTAIAHLSGALGRPTWVMLSSFGTDWRWLLNRDDSPWYSSARLFRQPKMGDWLAVTEKINQYLSWFKI